MCVGYMLLLLSIVVVLEMIIGILFNGNFVLFELEMVELIES